MATLNPDFVAKMSANSPIKKKIPPCKSNRFRSVSFNCQVKSMRNKDKKRLCPMSLRNMEVVQH